MFYTRLQHLCKQKNTTISSMLKELNLSTGNTGAWKSGALPKGDALVKIADYLNTSIDYLVKGVYKYDLDEDENRLLSIYRSIPEKAKYKLLCDFERIANDETKKLKHQNNETLTHK